MNALASKLYKRITNFILAFVVATATLTAIGPFMAPNASALSLTVVNPGDANWSTSETRSNGAVNFVADADTPYGDGALQLVTGANTGSPMQDKANTLRYFSTPVALSSVTGEVSYFTKQISASFAAGLPSFQIPVLLDGTPGSFTTLVYEPYVDQGNGAVLANTWQKWTVSGAGKLWSSKAYGTIVASQGSTTYTFADILALYPNTQVLGFGVNVGSNNPYWDTRVDGVTFNDDTYDFEPFTIPACSTDATTFDTFSTGSVNGQGGWESTGPFDQAIVENNYGIESFGCKSLRLSNAVTSGSFGDQTFSYSTPNEAGEADSTSAGESGGTRVNRYEAQFDIASTQPTVQTGLSVSVSPDRGDGSRMSYLRFEDQADGIHVYFDDYQVDTFVETELTTLSRAAHTIKFVIDYKDGASNDVVSVYIDGALVHTGTTWEDYYRTDPSQSFEQSPRTTDSLLFRVAGTAAPANSGKGFLFDNVAIATSDSTVVVPEQPGSGEEEVTGTTTTTTTTTTVITPIITNPASVLGASDDTDTNTEGNSDVEGTTDDKTATTDKGMNGIILGLAWYWWIIILAGAAGLTWWIVAAYRRRNTEE